MSLIPCPECGRQVSDSALSCPACGYPAPATGQVAGSSAASVPALGTRGPGPLSVGERITLRPTTPEPYDNGIVMLRWEHEDDPLLGRSARIIEIDEDGTFKIDIDPRGGWFAPTWVEGWVATDVTSVSEPSEAHHYEWLSARAWLAGISYWLVLVMVAAVTACMITERGEWSPALRVGYIAAAWAGQALLSALMLALLLGFLPGGVSDPLLILRGAGFLGGLPFTIYAMWRSRWFVTCR